jgi:DNA-binding CsgD family transcriptional regulator
MEPCGKRPRCIRAAIDDKILPYHVRGAAMEIEGPDIDVLIASLGFRPGGRDETRVERHLVLLETLAGMDGVSVALYDLAERRYRFLRTVFAEAFGIPKEAAASGNLAFFADRIHPDDRGSYFATSAEVLRFLLSRPPDERKDYRTYVDFRFASAPGQWLRLSIQNSVLETDAEGIPWLVLSIIEPSPLRDPELPLRRSLKRKSSGEFVLFPEKERTLSPELSPREREILSLVSKGYSSPDIARILVISVHTVNTHRRNAMGKLDAQNSSEAVRYAAERGLI